MQTATRIQVTRRPERFVADDRRVITRFFNAGGDQRQQAIIHRVLGLSEQEIERLLVQILNDFGPRHRDIERALQENYRTIEHLVPEPHRWSQACKRLLGAYFTMEYSVESAALFNPSMVLHPDQSRLKPGQARVLMSLRATGEGHISSIVFRNGVVNADGEIHFDPPSRFAARMKREQDRQYEKHLFAMKLSEMGAFNEFCQAVLDVLDDTFTFDELEHAVDRCCAVDGPELHAETSENLLWLARSNYHLILPPETDPSEVVIFPTSENESNGIEDTRLTRFVDDDGKVTYFGTYTAYNGYRILPQLLETQDFSHIEVHTLNGLYVQNKGMALFPRKIHGSYYMLSRVDGENMFIMWSDNLYFWNECLPLQQPRYAWEFVQIGNCGPPIETEAGWVVLTHGVGPMRQYCIGVSLLDLDDPTRVLGHLDEPLLMPEEHERDGYVPNVVYSCGAVPHQDLLVIPYAVSDRATTFATLNLNELIEVLLHHPPRGERPNPHVPRGDDPAYQGPALT